MIKQKIIINGIVTTETGLSIGGTNDDIGIASKDNPIIRNPLTDEPYIPGSSIKGKMRSLMERSGMANGKSFPCNCGDSKCKVCKLFGSFNNRGTARVIFRDAQLSEEFRNLPNIIENKYETAIDRETGKAKTGSLRQKERIAAGVNFDYEIIILVNTEDNPAELQSLIENGLRMIETTGLGSKVSAGYGKVNFHIGEDTYKVKISDFIEV